MKQYILGINLPLKSKCHEAGVALIDKDGNIIFAMNEERLSRIKLDGNFPEESIKKMLEYTGIKKEDIGYAIVPTLNYKNKIIRFTEFVIRERWKHFLKFSSFKTVWRIILGEKNVSKIKDQERGGFKIKYYWRDFLKDNFPNAKIVEVDHHLAHASGAYFTSPWKNSLIVSIDGAGNYLTSIIAKGENGKIKVIDKTFIPHSAGTFWGSITKVCGFKSGTRHGGKVTGLAARGDPNKLINKFRLVIKCQGLRFKVKEELFFDKSQLVPNWASYEPERMRTYIGQASREDIAAGAQKRLEEVILKLILNARKEIKHNKIVVAGGVFANVLLNQEILRLPEIEDMYIFPAMSDGGLALGAALYFLSKLKIRNNIRLYPVPLKSIYLGPDYNLKDIEKYLNIKRIRYKKMENPAREVAELINSNKVVALFQGRMEYGPRALGNRSIIYAPTDPAVNDWLNKKLKRSEFMPFAPVTLIEHIKDCYIDIVDNPLAAKYMTITYDCTDKMINKAPACVHVDSTARPQIIKREDNPYYYDILKEYYNLTGIPTFINTSFNMHEEPIVCTVKDAARAFFSARLDYLVIEDRLCSLAENQHIKAENL